jgi:hypothetical protein
MTCLRGAVDGTVIEYPIQRVGRLDSTVAHAVLAAWASYQTRAALDHDFARMGAMPEKAEAVSPPPRLHPRRLRLRRQPDRKGVLPLRSRELSEGNSAYNTVSLRADSTARPTGSGRWKLILVLQTG